MKLSEFVNAVTEAMGKEVKAKPQCGNCRFFDYPSCKRNAPVYVRQAGSYCNARWPQPLHGYDDWCGDHEEKK